MLKKMIKTGCLVVAAGLLILPAWSADNAAAHSNTNFVLAHGGNGPGDGTGNGGTGPGDGTGNGPGDCG